MGASIRTALGGPHAGPVRLAATAFAATLLLGLGAAPALAADKPSPAGRPAPAGSVPAGAPKDAGVEPVVGAAARLPRGYVQVVSGSLAVGAYSQAFGSVRCPGQKVPIGGGVLISSSDLWANVAGSRPAGQNWFGIVNNNVNTATTFRVYAVCLRKPRGYSVVRTERISTPGTQLTNSATCPTGKVVFGGGGESESVNLGININTSNPSGSTGWRIDMNNSGTDTAAFETDAICAARPAFYTSSTSSATAPSYTESNAVASCPSNLWVSGGGLYSGSSSPYVSINSTLPLDLHSWRAYENNNSSNSVSFTVSAICIGS